MWEHNGNIDEKVITENVHKHPTSNNTVIGCDAVTQAERLRDNLLASRVKDEFVSFATWLNLVFDRRPVYETNSAKSVDSVT